MSFSLNVTFEVWDDDSGERLVVCPDADGLDCVDIRQVASDGRIVTRVTMNREQALLVQQALGEFLSRAQ